MLLSSATTTAAAKKPRKFRPVKRLVAVNVADQPQFANTTKMPTGAKGKGLRYEKQVTEYLDRSLDQDEWVGTPGVWFEFVDTDGHRFAQADWLGFNTKRGLICIAEVKLSRVPEAWWQLNRLYLPLVQYVFPKWDIAMLEITSQVYNVIVPEPVKVIHSFDTLEAGRTQVMRLPYGVR